MEHIQNVRLESPDCLVPFPGSEEYCSGWEAVDKLNRLDELSLEECQGLLFLARDYISADPAAAVYAEAVENPDRFSLSHVNGGEVPMTHLSVYGTCALPKLKYLNSYIGKPAADAFFKELGAEIMTLVRDSGVLYTVYDDNFFLAEHAKGLVLHYPLRGNSYSESDIRELNREIAKKTKAAARRLLPKYIDGPIREAFDNMTYDKAFLDKYAEEYAHTKEELLRLKRRLYEEPLAGQERQEVETLVERYETVDKMQASHLAAEAQFKYLSNLRLEIDNGGGVEFLYGISRIDFTEAETRDDKMLEAHRIIGDSITGAKQAAQRKDVFGSGTPTSAYPWVNTAAWNTVGEGKPKYRGKDKRDDSQEYSQTMHFRDLLAGRAALVLHLGLDQCSFEDLDFIEEYSHFLTRNEDGEIMLTAEGANRLRKYGAFKMTPGFKSLDETVLDALVEEEWFKVIEFADTMKMVQLPFIPDYRRRIDAILEYKAAIEQAQTAEEARPLLEELAKLVEVSHKCEPNDNALTVFGRLRRINEHDRGLSILADAVGLGAANKGQYELNSLRIVNLGLEIVRADLPEKQDQYLALVDNIERPEFGDEEEKLKFEKQQQELRDRIILIGESPDMSNDEIALLFKRTGPATAFYIQWYKQFVSADVKAEIATIRMEGCDAVTAKLKQDTKELCGEVFNLGYRQLGDEIEAIGSIEGTEEHFYEDHLLRYLSEKYKDGVLDLTSAEFESYTFEIPENPTTDQLTEMGKRLHTSFMTYITLMYTESVELPERDPDEEELTEEEELRLELFNLRSADLFPNDPVYYYTLGKAIFQLHDEGFDFASIPDLRANPGWLEGLYTGVAESLAAVKIAQEHEARIRSELIDPSQKSKFRLNILQHDVPVSELIRTDIGRRALSIALSAVDEMSDAAFEAAKVYTDVGEVPPEWHLLVRTFSLRDIIRKMGINTDEQHQIQYPA